MQVGSEPWPWWRRGSESNRRIRVLQTPALPLGYPAVKNRQHSIHQRSNCKSQPASSDPRLIFREREKKVSLGTNFLLTLTYRFSIAHHMAARLPLHLKTPFVLDPGLWRRPGVPVPERWQSRGSSARWGCRSSSRPTSNFANANAASARRDTAVFVQPAQLLRRERSAAAAPC